MLLAGADTRAGMPSPPLSDFRTVSRLTDTARHRFEAISFFLAGLLLSALFVRLLWNGMARDFPRLPRLSYRAALGGVVLWGLMFVIVLTMIAGARELMTPGAWEKQGPTYKLAGTAAPAAPEPDRPDPRLQNIERLRTGLLRYAATHDGRFPDSLDSGEIPPALREVPDAPGLRYLYVPGLTARDGNRVLAFEPEIEHARRLLVTADGEVRAVTSEEPAKLLGGVTPR